AVWAERRAAGGPQGAGLAALDQTVVTFQRVDAVLAADGDPAEPYVGRSGGLGVDRPRCVRRGVPPAVAAVRTGDPPNPDPPYPRHHPGETEHQEPISRAGVEGRRRSGQRDGEDGGKPSGRACRHLTAEPIKDRAHTRVGGADHGESRFNRARHRPREMRRARAVEPGVVRRVHDETRTPASKRTGASGIRDLEADQHAEGEVSNMEDGGFATWLQADQVRWRAAQDRRPPLGEWDQGPLVVAL